MDKLKYRVATRRGWILALGLYALTLGTNPTFSQAQTPVKMATPSLEVTSVLGRRLYALPDDESVTAARKRLATNPKNVALVLALSKGEAGRRQYKEAVATCTKGLLIAPRNADLYVERGHRELGLREFKQAMQDLK